MVTDKLMQQLVFWGVWIIIPLFCEIFIGIVSAVIVLVKWGMKKEQTLDFYPKVTVLIPVYNSQSTLEMCLTSVYNQEYPRDSLEVFLIDNGSKDASYEVFCSFQASHPDLRLWWISSSEGKSRALNKGIFSSEGKYVINIDSDGWLEANAIKNVVIRFESDTKIACMTGVVLIDEKLVEKTKKIILKGLRLCELFEYTESFLVGRNFSSTFNTMFTLAGAFSCFRREVLLQTQMYNSDTLGEDTHMTFQVRNFIKGRVILCEDAFFYVDPIESIDKLYTQRQRWQRGELEVASMFKELSIGGLIDYFRKFTMRILLSDHTMAFPRLVWYFAMVYLYFINYPLRLIIGANILLYAIYVFSSFLYMGVARLYLVQQKNVRDYMAKHWYTCFLMPIYRLLVYWMRVAGIINSLTTDSRWRTKTLSEEFRSIKNVLVDEPNTKYPVFKVIGKKINRE